MKKIVLGIWLISHTALALVRDGTYRSTNSNVILSLYVWTEQRITRTGEVRSSEQYMSVRQVYPRIKQVIPIYLLNEIARGDAGVPDFFFEKGDVVLPKSRNDILPTQSDFVFYAVSIAKINFIDLTRSNGEKILFRYQD